MNQTEIDELRRLASVSREPRHGIGCIASDCALASAARNALPRLLAALDEARAERDRMRDVLLRNNFAPCDTQACNCNGWHDRATGNGFYARFREIEEAIGDHNGKTLLAAVVEMVQERDALQAKLDEASRKVQEMCERIGRIHIADYVTESVEVCEGLDRIRAVLLDSRDMDALKMQLAAAKADRANLIRINRLLRDRPDLGDRAKTVDALIADYGAAETQAWDALGRPDGTHDTSNVQRLCEAHGALKAKLADAEAERSEARSLLLNGIQTNGDSLAFLEHVRREHAAVVAERDAIKATLAKRAESERAWCELATERGAKLAALVEAMERIKDIMGGHDGCQGFSSPEDVWGIADKALAAAKVQP